MTLETPAALTARALIESECVLFRPKDPFTFVSGRISPVYVDVRRLISFAQHRKRVMDLAADVVRGIKTDVLAGGETAGIPYAAFIADRLDLPMIYVRKKPKGHGRLAQIEGAVEEGARAILIEDMQTDGGSKRVFVEALRAAGLVCVDAFVIFHYGIFARSQENMVDLGITLHALCTWWDILAAARTGIGGYDTATLDALEIFLHNPEDWTPSAQG